MTGMLVGRTADRLADPGALCVVVLSPWEVLGRVISGRHHSTVLNGIAAGDQGSFAHHGPRSSIVWDRFRFQVTSGSGQGGPTPGLRLICGRCSVSDLVHLAEQLLDASLGSGQLNWTKSLTEQRPQIS